jgi:ABC-type dipeptide/oligopeptide/nickel transport system permease subunit
VNRFRFLRTGSGVVGLVVAFGVVALALVGPFFAPHAPDETIGLPGMPASRAALLGTDFLGRDVLSRVLWGGRSVLALATIATVLAYAGGVCIGLVAGYARAWSETVLMRTMDAMRVFPPLLFLLMLISGLGTGTAVLVLGVALVQVPGIARLMYTATLQTTGRGYVEAAVARGETTIAILRREILPNALVPLIADAGLRFTFSILFVAGVTFLSLGLQPPAADWALMINENRDIVSLNPWVILVPAVLLAALTIGINLLGDAVSRSLGQSR